MANISNPRKKYNWTIAFPGFALEPFLVQNVEIPDREIEVVEHGDTNYDVKTGGRVKLGMLTLEKIMTTSGSDGYFEGWMAMINDSFTGGGSTPTTYKRTIVVTELAEDGTTALNIWTMTGCWPSKRNGLALDRTESDNTIESLEICVDRMIKA
jgi:phage tail-like protein